MLDVGRLCVKIAGREAGSKCVVVEVADKNFVVVDGNVRRKRCNVSHLEPLDQKIDLDAGGSHDLVVAAFEKIGILSKVKKVVKSPKASSEKPNDGAGVKSEDENAGAKS